MERTFAIIKPTAFKNNLTGAIINKINSAGFRISAIKSLKLSEEKARKLYGIHSDKTFFPELIEFITSGKIVVMILEKENAVEDFRYLIGNTDPANAEAGTIRKLFGIDKTKNAVHASDSPENARKEINIFFSDDEV